MIEVVVGIVITVIVLSVIGAFANRQKSSRKHSESATSIVDGSIIRVSMKDMDAVFNRSSGRYCDHCGVYGSHHTDRHNVFALYALKNAHRSRDIPDISSLVKVKTR